MTSFQKVIKYIALAFGIFLAIQIISWILIGIGILFGITTVNEKVTNTQELIQYDEGISNVKNIKISTDIAKLMIKTSESFKIEASNLTEKFNIDNYNQTLIIDDNGISDEWIREQYEMAEIVLYIPEDTLFESIEIEAGIGDVQIEELLAEKLNIKLGAGNTNIEKVYAKEAEIEGGAGKGSIKNATISNLDLDTGAGKFELEGIFTGYNKIDCGIGKLELTLDGGKDNYTITTDNGIGAVYIDGKKVENDANYGNGENKIEIENGIGAVEIKFK